MQAQLAERTAELEEIKAELKEAVTREGAKSVELSRAQQDLIIAEKAHKTLKAERDELGKKVVALRSTQLKAEASVTDSQAVAAEAQVGGGARQAGGRVGGAAIGTPV